jgi:hypothetical protein
LGLFLDERLGPGLPVAIEYQHWDLNLVIYGTHASGRGAQKALGGVGDGGGGEARQMGMAMAQRVKVGGSRPQGRAERCQGR